MQSETQLGPVREGDVSLTLAFQDMGYRGADLKKLNRVRKYLCLVHKSDLVASDGVTVIQEVLECEPGYSERHKFRKDYCLFGVN